MLEWREVKRFDFVAKEIFGRDVETGGGGAPQDKRVDGVTHAKGVSLDENEKEGGGVPICWKINESSDRAVEERRRRAKEEDGVIFISRVWE